MKNTRYWKLYLLIATLLPVVFSCESSFPEKPEKTANEYIYEKFLDWYLWYDQIPDIDPTGIDTEEALIDSIRHPNDRWSYSTAYSLIEKWYERGEYTGFGGGFIIDIDGFIKISFVYNNSPLANKGVNRGWKVLSVNGFTVNETDSVNAALSSDGEVLFEMEDLEGTKHTFGLTRQEIATNSVIHSSVHTINGHNIGYFVLNNFINTSPGELKTVIDTFKQHNITDLIIDLRYNGGGLNSVAYQLIGMIGGETLNGQIISTQIHNDKHSDSDKPQILNYEGPFFDVQNVCFITTHQTASASELVINSIEPFNDVGLVGSNTHGKPVGMYIFNVEKLDLAILPICFKTINSIGYGDYYNGLAVDVTETDDLDHNWGDSAEAMFKTAVDYLTAPALATTETSLKKQQASQQKPLQYKGINRLINAY